MANNQRIILWVVIGFLVYQSGMLGNLFGNTMGAGGTTTTTTTTPTPATPATPAVIEIKGPCGVDSTTVTVAAQNYYTLAATGGIHRYSVNGNPAKAASDGGTFTSSPGELIHVLFYNVTVPPQGFTYYPEVMDYTVGCEGTKTLAAKLYQNSTFTVRVFNEEGDLITGTGDYNETLGAADTVTLTGDMAGDYQKAASPFGGIVIAEYNSSTMDDVVVSFNGVSTKKPTPTFHTVSYTTHVTKSYEVPKSIGNSKIPMTVYLDVDNDENPTEVTGEDILLRFCSASYYVDEDDQGAYKIGVEDEDGLQVGTCYPYTLSVD